MLNSHPSAPVLWPLVSSSACTGAGEGLGREAAVQLHRMVLENAQVSSLSRVSYLAARSQELRVPSETQGSSRALVGAGEG